MTLADLVNGESVFLDANILVYHFAPHPTFGPACNDLVRRVENLALLGYTSTAVLSDVAHHLMTFEASPVFGRTSKVGESKGSGPDSNFRVPTPLIPQLSGPDPFDSTPNPVATLTP